MPIPTPRNAQDRALILDRCRKDKKVRADVIEQARTDNIFFINTFIWSFDPREDAPVHETPFFLYDFQEELIIRRLDRALVGLDDLLFEKSRDVGLTWTVLAWMFHKWIFKPGWSALLGSRKEQYVDDRTMDSHFGKLDFIIRHLPGWFLGEALPGFHPLKHRKKLVLINASKKYPGCFGNALKGESSNAEFGRAGRQGAIYFDEAGFFHDFDSAWRAAGQVTRTRIGGSTPNGMNAWGRLVNHPENAHRKVSLKWDLHPLHDDAWYRRECKRLVLPEDIAQELDMNYQRSTRGLIYPNWDKCLFGVYDYDPAGILYVSWDFGLDATAIIWWQRHPITGQVTMLDSYQRSDKPLSWYVPFITGEMPDDRKIWKEYSADEVEQITIHHTWRPAIHFGDPSVKQRNIQTGTSPFEVLKEAKIHVICNSALNNFKDRRRMTMEGLQNLQVNLGSGAVGCSAVNDAMLLSRFQDRDPDSQASTEPAPVHDASSHYRSSVEYFWTNLPPFRTWKRPEATVAENIYDHLTR